VHLWLVKVDSLSEPDSIFIGVCRGCMPLDQDPQDLRDRTYYLRFVGRSALGYTCRYSVTCHPNPPTQNTCTHCGWAHM